MNPSETWKERLHIWLSYLLVAALLWAAFS